MKDDKCTEEGFKGDDCQEEVIKGVKYTEKEEGRG